MIRFGLTGPENMLTIHQSVAAWPSLRPLSRVIARKDTATPGINGQEGAMAGFLLF